MDTKIKLSQIVGSYFIRYDAMNNCIGEAFKGSTATEVTMYIDMYSIIKRLLQSDYSYDSHSELSALMIDMCIYYREYFKRFGVYCNFVIVCSYNLPITSKSIIGTYNQDMAYLLTQNTEFLQQNIEYLKILCPYLPNIHFVYTEIETGVMMYHISKMYKQDCPSIILSKDAYNLQLLSLIPNSVFIRPKKHNGNDVSMIAYDNATEWKLFYDFMNIAPNDNLLEPVCLDHFMAITKLPQRNLPSLVSSRTILSFINSRVRDNMIRPDQFTIHYACENMNEKYKKLSKLISDRLNVISISYQWIAYNLTAESKTISLTNLYDPEGVKHINNVYFSKNPIDLDRI